VQQNLLRKSLYYNHDYYHSRAEVEFSDPDWAQRLHVCKFPPCSRSTILYRLLLMYGSAHCLDILRQRLMCSTDIGVFGSYWVQNGTHLRPFVDFNTEHVCQNFDAIRAWAEERQIPNVVPDDFMEEPGTDVKILDEFP
jgi:Mycotoxin biosynthesis protein UstYa